MNSVILDFSSSGEGNGGGGGGFCAMCGQTSSQRSFVATFRLKSDSHARRLFRGFGFSICRRQVVAGIGDAGFPSFAAGIADPGYNLLV